MKSTDAIIEEIKGLKEIIEKEFEHNRTGHEAILIQTTKTNGRVTRLEEWKNQVSGAWGLVKFLGIGNVILLIALWVQHILE